MKKRLFRVAWITLASILVSVLFTAVLMHVMFGNIPSAGLIIAALVPILAGLPITLIIDGQRRKLNDVVARLKQAHEQLESLNIELEQQARFDYMTGFLNRRYFVKSVTEKCARDQSGAILCIDVDDFKEINDSFGHLVGDEALKLIAHTIAQMAPEGALLARMGGEEFSVFLPGADGEQTGQAAEQLRTAVEAMTFEPVQDVLHQLSVSIGAAILGPTKDFEVLFGEADLNMYKAKRQGKNRTVLPAPNQLGQVA